MVIYFNQFVHLFWVVYVFTDIASLVLIKFRLFVGAPWDLEPCIRHA